MPDQKFIYILWQSQTFCARQKDDLRSEKLVFVPTQEEALNAVLKKFGPAQNILGPVKGQGISLFVRVVLRRKKKVNDLGEMQAYQLARV